MENNLEIGFDRDDSEIEVSKYGKKQIQKKKIPYITFILVATLIIVLFIANVYQFYLINIKKNENKYLKEELRKIKLEKNNIITSLHNKEKDYNELTEKYNEEKNKNFELSFNNTAGLNKKYNDLEINNRVLELENQRNKEKIELLQKEKEEIFNSHQKFKEEFVEKYYPILEELENYPSIKRDKDDRNIVVIENEMTDIDMQQDVARVATGAIEMTDKIGVIANIIKSTFDEKYNSKWECVVGYDFGASITSEKERYIVFNIGKYTILLFQSPS